MEKGRKGIGKERKRMGKERKDGERKEKGWEERNKRKAIPEDIALYALRGSNPGPID